MRAWWMLVGVAWAWGGAMSVGGAAEATERIRVTWGHQSRAGSEFALRFVPEGDGVRVLSATPIGLEVGEAPRVEGAWISQAGEGDVDGVDLVLGFPAGEVVEDRAVHSIWQHLLDHGDPEAASRLLADPAVRRDPRRLGVRIREGGGLGFSLTVDQMRRRDGFWLPEWDVFLAVGERPVPWEEHRKALEPLRGQRVRDRVWAEPEASYQEYARRWEDMGSPAYRNPHQVGPGHLVGVAWEGSVPKFGIDRWGGVWSDYGNPDRFRVGFDFNRVETADAGAWRGQTLTDGLPIVRTVLEREGVRWELEQFAFPLEGPPAGRKGDITLVLCQRVVVVNLEDRDRSVRFELVQERPGAGPLESAVRDGWITLESERTGETWAAVSGRGVRMGDLVSAGNGTNRLSLGLELGGRGIREFRVLLPTPRVAASKREALLGLDFESARKATVAFWTGWLERGAKFEVPERVVNDLFRANLWHALRLPRRHGAGGPEAGLDLPYSNFAYDQKGTPWPVNQAVYVDAQLYDLRGYHDVSEEELAAMFRGNQEPDGRIGGFANWGVYTPSMVYATARQFRLSGDREGFGRLLPRAWASMEWCLRQIEAAAERSGPAPGLVLAPLNDLTHEPRAWAFNQAYLFAAADELARALAGLGDSRAAACRRAAERVSDAVRREFGRASARSPLVPLRDGTWIPFVPGDALTPGRQLKAWYPTDVDTGPLHLVRLGALDAHGPLATAMLHDHEDTLFFRGWGMANEPVYQPHAAAWLARDDVPMVLRTFYSMTACAFSHSALEPVEHRWGWGQYFGPPSTDGAWFELYRSMLLREPDDERLWLCQATPASWWRAGRRIEVQRAPTLFGPVGFTVESAVDEGVVRASVRLDARRTPREIRMRFRHPDGRSPESAWVNGRRVQMQRGVASRQNGQCARDFGHWVVLEPPDAGRYEILVRYARDGADASTAPRGPTGRENTR